MLLFLDIETTGFDPHAAELLELSAVRFDGNKVTATFDELVQLESKGSEIPPLIQKLTGIKKEMLTGKPPLEEVRTKFLKDFLRPSDLVVGHNISFDTGFLRGKGFQFENSEIDTYPLATILLPEEESHSLEVMTEKYGLLHDPAHRALGDALANLELWKLLQTVLMEKFPASFQEKCREILRKSGWSGKKFFLDCWRAAGKISSAASEERQLSLLSEPAVLPAQESEHSFLKSPTKKLPAEKTFQNDVVTLFAQEKKVVWEVLMAAPSDPFVLAAEAAVQSTLTSKRKIGICFHGFDSAKAHALMSELQAEYPTLSCVEVRSPEMVLCGTKWQNFLQKEVFSDLETIMALKILREEGRGEYGAPNLRREEWSAWQEVSDRFHEECFDTCAGKNLLLENLWEKHDVFFFPHKLLKEFPGDTLLLTGFEKADEIFTIFGEKSAGSRRLRLAAGRLEKPLCERLFFFLDLLNGYFRKDFSDLSFSAEIPLENSLLARKEWQEFEQSLVELAAAIQKDPAASSDLLAELKNWQAVWSAVSKNELFTCRLFPDDELEFIKSPIALQDIADEFFKTKKSILALGWPFPKTSTGEARFAFKFSPELEQYRIFPLLEAKKRLKIFAPEGFSESEHTLARASGWLQSFLVELSGNALGVFPSQKMVEEVEEFLTSFCTERGIRLISHRSGSTGKVRRFLTQAGRKLFLATPYLLERVFPLSDSEDFDLVFFHKFLFDPPGNLLVTARKKLWTNAFEEYIVPRSLARFEQEVFRLLRGQEASYSFFCFDPRFSTDSGYGRSYRKMLPEELSFRQIQPEEIPTILA